MRASKIFLFWQKIKKDMASMSTQEKINHIWYHFKWYIIAIIIGTILLISLVVSIVSSAKHDLLGGGIINVSISDAGSQFLSGDYIESQGYDTSRNQVILYNPGLTNMTAEQLKQNANFTISFMTMIGAQELDFLIVDQVALKYYMDQGLYMNLQEVFSEAQLQCLDSYLVYGSSISGKSYPVGICIDHLAFTADCIESDSPVYLLFIGNAKHTDQLSGFYDYLCSWSTNK